MGTHTRMHSQARRCALRAKATTASYSSAASCSGAWQMCLKLWPRRRMPGAALAACVLAVVSGLGDHQSCNCCSRVRVPRRNGGARPPPAQRALRYRGHHPALVRMRACTLARGGGCRSRCRAAAALDCIFFLFFGRVITPCLEGALRLVRLVSPCGLRECQPGSSARTRRFLGRGCGHLDSA